LRDWPDRVRDGLRIDRQEIQPITTECQRAHNNLQNTCRDRTTLKQQGTPGDQRISAIEMCFSKGNFVMASDVKIGLLLGLVFIFVIAFLFEGLRRGDNTPDSSESITVMVNESRGIVPEVPPEVFPPVETDDSMNFLNQSLWSQLGRACTTLYARAITWAI
ncbi:MAG: hypothetical protein ACYTEK_25700, partial [Planctomycetota bacterium]